MRTEEILPQLVYIDNVKETKELADFYIPQFIENFNKKRKLSGDWNIHTDYHRDLDDTNPEIYQNISEIDFSLAEKVYSKYINNFIYSHLPMSSDLKWQFEGMWYNVYGENQEAEIHDHGGHSFSLVHYLQYEKGSHSPIVFVDNYANGNTHSLNIDNGDIIMFRSYTKHMVGPNNSDKPRISIAFNIGIPGIGISVQDEQNLKNLTEEEIALQKYCDSLIKDENE